MNGANKICPICESLSYRRIHRLSQIDLFQCRSCGAIHGENRKPFSGKETDDWSADEANVASYYDSQFEKKNIEYLRFFALATNSLATQNPKSRARLLDIGCAYGAFLNTARQEGWHVTGIEPSTAACAWARHKFGLSPVNSLYSANLFAPDSFDLITFFDVIEHVPYPKQFLADVRLHLAPGGHVMMTVPNFQSLTSHLCLWSYPLTLGKLTLPSELLTQVTYCSHHHWYFSVKSLTQLLNQSGFDVVASTTTTTLDADNFFNRKDLETWPSHLRALSRMALSAVQATEKILNARDTLICVARKSSDSI